MDGTGGMKKKQLVRAKFSEAVFARDGHTCKFCDRTDNLDAHHITDRNEMSNGISLCHTHHMDAEQFHILGGRNWVNGVHPDDLYKLIESSKEKVEADSRRLL